MKRLAMILGGAGLAALTLSACNPPHPHPHKDMPLRVISRLECPEDAGDLTLKSAEGDGKSCLYTSDDGALVTLQLVDLAGKDAATALAPLETQLKAELPPNPNAAVSESDKVDIDLPGIHIHANGDDKAGGKDHGAATVEAKAPGGGGVTVNANDNGAEIHVGGSGAGIRQMFILASDTAGPNGYKLVGYEARGPVGGPVMVASVKGKEKDHDDLFHDVGKLLDRNVGGASGGHCWGMTSSCN